MGCGRSIRRPGGRGLMNRARHRVPFLSSAPERPGPSLPLRLDGFSDVSFSQSGGRALRATATWQVTRRPSVEPYIIRWDVDPSPGNDLRVTFTVNKVQASQLLGFYEPTNATSEFGARVGVRFCNRKSRSVDRLLS